MMQGGRAWGTALAEAGCFDFLEPVASHAVDAVFERRPDAAALVDSDARRNLQSLCLARLTTVYERPVLAMALRRVGLVESLTLKVGGEPALEAMRGIARDVSSELAADAGASLRARLPFAIDYERVVADNFSEAVAEFLGRIAMRADDVSRALLGGRPITRLTGVSASGADPHRHGRLVMSVFTDAGPFVYKPHDCRIDALYRELVARLFPHCARAAELVEGDGYAFVERLVPEAINDEEGLRSYWRNFGCLTALLHGLGSRDMTSDNLMCCGTRPAVLDLETLLTGEMDFDRDAPLEFTAMEGVGADELANSVACTAIPPQRVAGRLVSPLVADNSSGTCLPRVDGEPRTIRGFEQDFVTGFEQGYRRLMDSCDEVLETVARYGDATCRQILLNTYAYAQARGLLFSTGAMTDASKRDEVLQDLNTGYALFSPELCRAVADADATTLMEGDIPYYCSHAGSRMLYAGDGRALGELLKRSAIEVVRDRLSRFSEDELGFELSLIMACLKEETTTGGKL